MNHETLLKRLLQSIHQHTTISIQPTSFPVVDLHSVAAQTTWVDQIVSLSSAYHFTATFEDHNVREIAILADPTHPFLRCIPDETHNRALWILVLQRSRKGVDAVIISESSADRVTLTLEDLTLANNLASLHTPTSWVRLTNALHLEPLSLSDRPDLSKTHRPWHRLRALIRLEKSDIYLILLLAILIGLLALATPVAVQALVNTVAFGTLLQPLVILVVLLLSVLFLAGTLRVLEAYVIEYLQRRFFVRVSLDLAHRLPRLKNSLNSEYATPELVNRFFDIATVQKSAASILINGLELILQIAIGMIVLAFYHPFLLAFDVALFIAIFILIVFLGRGATYTALKESDSKYNVASWLEQLPVRPTLLKSSQGADFASRRTQDLVHTWVDNREQHFSIVFRQLLGGVIIQVAFSTILLGLGGWLVIQGELTLGQLVAAELIVTTVVVGVAKAGKYFETFYDMLAGIEKIGKLLDLPMESTRAPHMLHKKSDDGTLLTLTNVSLPNIASNTINLSIKEGESIGIWGADEESISLIFDYIYGLQNPEDGEVHLFGLSCHGACRNTTRDRMALIRGSDAFEGTIVDNLCLNLPSVDYEQARNALESVGLLGDILALPEALDTVLTPFGAPLSKPQRIKLAFARALIAQPAILLVDESLDRLRTKDRELILSAILDPSHTWTVIVASQTLSTVVPCDRVYHLVDTGLILEESV